MQRRDRLGRRAYNGCEVDVSIKSVLAAFRAPKPTAPLNKKALKGFSRSVQAVGLLRDGTLYIDAHVFDDDYGDYADTDYVAAGDVKRLKGLLGSLGLKVQADAELLEALAELFETAREAAAAINALGIKTVHRVDLGARNDLLEVMPT
jgi:hypothetical protein